MHALVAEHVLGVGVGEDVVDLDGDYLLRRDVGQQLEVVGLVRAYPVPGVEDELRVIGAGGFYDGPGGAHVGNAGIGHGLDAYHILPRPAAELGELLRVVQPLGEGVDVGLGAQADALEAGGLEGDKRGRAGS